jgi:uncharacterized membrane protein
MSEAPSSDADIVARISLLLRFGVIAAAVVLLIGGGVYLVRHSHEEVPDRSRFQPEPPMFSRPADIVAAALAGRGRAIIQFGLLLLIATPVLRVAYSALAFARRRDWVYVLVPSFVLLVLLVGLAFAPTGR